MSSLTANIEIPANQTGVDEFVVRLLIHNPTKNTIRVFNPNIGRPSPGMKWPWSLEVYQTSMLISFHYLSITVAEESGRQLPQQTIETWATPVLPQPVELHPGKSITVLIPLGKFYQLNPGQKYWLSLEYGEKDMKVSAKKRITVR
ncbi:MAG: hypothetical protein OEZ39_17195 [Gammaproteobacteria bacterium]|nr:hypothetical protein [Gammaproteobacteria bacterium]